MPKLHEVIAVLSGKKTKAEKTKTDVYKKVQKSDLFDGLLRTYEPDQEDGEQLPQEKKNIQLTVTDAIEEFKQCFGDLIDVVATQDTGNCSAKADVVVDNKVILESVPVTHLLYLEKQLTDFATFVRHLPVLDAAEKWTYSEADACYRSDPKGSRKTKKVLRNHIKAEATDKHPAQVETYSEDVGIGTWTATRFSGAISQQQKNVYTKRLTDLIEAVKVAREQANSIDITPVKESDKIFGYLFG